MKQRFLSVVTGNYFQHYLPLFVCAVRTWSKDVKFAFAIKGKLDGMTIECMNILQEYGLPMDDCMILPEQFADYPARVSTTNCLRFLWQPEDYAEYDETMIVDADLLLFTDPFPMHRAAADEAKQPFAGHHGPHLKPERPEICTRWAGAFERVAGGFVYVRPEWYDITAAQREFQACDTRDSRNGYYRESDEVMLARIIKGSNLRVPQSKYFPPELRGVHLGDYKMSMTHRFKNMAKMIGKLTNGNCRAFLEIEKTECWQALLAVLKADNILSQQLQNVRNHIDERGIV